MRKLIAHVDDDVFLAKLAVYAHERAYMKDMPAALLLALSRRDTELMHRVFDRVSTTVASCARCSKWSVRASSVAWAFRLRYSARSALPSLEVCEATVSDESVRCSRKRPPDRGFMTSST